MSEGLLQSQDLSPVKYLQAELSNDKKNKKLSKFDLKS